VRGVWGVRGVRGSVERSTTSRQAQRLQWKIRSGVFASRVRVRRRHHTHLAAHVVDALVLQQRRTAHQHRSAPLHHGVVMQVEFESKT